MITLDTYLRPEAVAEHLNVSVKTLSNWRHRGQGPSFVRAGANIRCPQADVQAYLDAGRVEAVA